MNFKPILTAAACLLTLHTGTARESSAVYDTLGTVKSSAQSPAELLRGQVAGVRVSSIDGNPNGELNVNIRGINSLRGNAQPLWIVDGAVIGSSLNNNLNAFFLSGGESSIGSPLPDYSERSYTSPLGNFTWLNPYDIKSVEVLKDVSATALYGMNGANGVIIVTTGRHSPGNDNVNWDSNMSIDLPSQTGTSFKTAISHNHSVSVGGMTGSNSRYNISAFFRQKGECVAGDNAIGGGLAVNYTTKASRLFHFGLNSFLAYNDRFSASGTAFIGSPSQMMLERKPSAFPDDSADGYVSDYDDKAVDYRTVNSVWLGINFFTGFNLKLTAGVDYQNQTRYFWYGTKTSFGKEFNGVNAILNNSLFNYNAKAELNFNRNISVKNHVSACATVEINGYRNKTNDMLGSNFDLKYLRWRSISSSGSNNVINKFSRNYAVYGGALRLGYDYDGAVGAGATFRADRNSRYDKGFTLFPAADVFADLHKAFFKSSKSVSTLRLEGGWGKAGRETVLPYEYLNLWIDDIPSVESGTEYYHDGMNRLLSTEANAGLSLGFLSDRYTLSVKWFDKSTADNFRIFNTGKIVSKQMVTTSAWTVLDERESTLKTRGVEAEADLRIVRRGAFDWTVHLDAAFNCGREFELCLADKTADELATRNTNVIPALYGGLSTTFRYDRLTLEARLNGASGHEILNAAEQKWEKGDFLRLSNLTISYDIPFKAKWIKAFKVNLTGCNLLTFTGYSGWNPDVSCYGAFNRRIGIDCGSYPLIRSILLGVSARF